MIYELYILNFMLLWCHDTTTIHTLDLSNTEGKNNGIQTAGHGFYKATTSLKFQCHLFQLGSAHGLSHSPDIQVGQGEFLGMTKLQGKQSKITSSRLLNIFCVQSSKPNNINSWDQLSIFQLLRTSELKAGAFCQSFLSFLSYIRALAHHTTVDICRHSYSTYFNIQQIQQQIQHALFHKVGIC